MGRGILKEVWDGSGDPWGGPRWFGGPLGGWDGSKDAREGLRCIGGPSGRFGTGQGTLGEDWDGSANP